ncbi:MAG: hypothetical protein LBU18_00770 [Treponema sp.]|jgi:hypothetical protein|nr:hypothetical protein [Treponema sp.]
MVKENTAAVHKEISEYHRCVAVLEQEREFVANIAGIQALVRRAVIERKWLDFESHMETLGRIAVQFEALDKERVRIFAALSGSAGGNTPGKDGNDAAGFYAFVSRFPPEERKDAACVYRQLKMEALKVRIESGVIMNYLSEAGQLLSDFLEAAFPDRKGKIYSRSGVKIQADMRSMVLNQHF